MRIAIIVLVLAVVALVGLSSGAFAPTGPAPAFATEVSSFGKKPVDPCTRYCNGLEVKTCGTSPSGNNGCDHVVNNSCVYVLCGP